MIDTGDPSSVVGEFASAAPLLIVNFLEPIE